MRSQLKVRTEYSFRTAFGAIDKVVAHLKNSGCNSAAMTDRNSTFGHVQWQKQCKDAGIKPIFGVELGFVPDVTIRAKREQLFYLPLLARSDKGLREIYSLVEEATANFYYVPRLNIGQLHDITQDICILSGNSGIGIHNSALPATVLIEQHPATNIELLKRNRCVPVSDNYMISPLDRIAYEVAMGRGAFNRVSPMHIMNEHELRGDHCLADRIADECNAELTLATNVVSFETKSLIELCIEGAARRGIDIEHGRYRERMFYELEIIAHKKYTDYFKVIADMVQYAKTQMLVGPARGSSCGSLVCYLLGITDIDPLLHGLIFERFIDLTRSDLPDVDIDFADDKRDLVFEYLENKYGNERVARLGTVSRYKAKSAIAETAKAVKIPSYEADQISEIIIKRNDGDDRADYCIVDSLTDADIGGELLKRYPSIIVAAQLEAHARHSGIHAAGVLITNEPINNFVARDVKNNSVHLDKYDCEALNLMKVDCLGLRTLSIIADCLDQVGWDKETLLAFPLDYAPAYSLLQSRLFSGVFQFTGKALQNLCRKVKPDRFTDLVSLTALARPGPLISGASYEWCARRNGKSYQVDAIIEDITSETFGLIVYQEQVIRIAREIGGLSWEDCTSLRKGMGKSLGIEYMDQYYPKFLSGTKEKFGLEDTQIRSIWETINSSGAYSFNKSHSVAYALVSYWCMVLKAKFPLEFALANLRYAKDPMQVKDYLREMDRAGHKFVLYDVDKSELNWSVKDGVLVGGLLNIKGIGDKKSVQMLERRRQNLALKLPAVISTPFDDIFELREKFADLISNPRKYGIVSKLTELMDIEADGTYVFIAKVSKFKIRSANEPKFLMERGGLRLPNDKWLQILLADDTDTIYGSVLRNDYAEYGQPITKNKPDDYYLFRGKVVDGNRRLRIEKWRKL